MDGRRWKGWRVARGMVDGRGGHRRNWWMESSTGSEVDLGKCNGRSKHVRKLIGVGKSTSRFWLSWHFWLSLFCFPVLAHWL